MKRRLSYLLLLMMAATWTQAAHAQQTQLYWGDTHLHTNYSPDAFALMTETADPHTSYRFAKGLPVVADMTRSRVQIRTPLDFLVVTDHAEFMGVISELAQGNEELMAIDGAARWNEMLNAGKGGEVFFRSPSRRWKQVSPCRSSSSRWSSHGTNGIP